MPSTPLGCVYDLAACCLSKDKMNKAMKVVYTPGCTWRYECNAMMSGVLVIDKSGYEHKKAFYLKSILLWHFQGK